MQERKKWEEEAAIANHLRDHEDHMSVRQQFHQVAGEAKVSYSVVGCFEIDKHSSGPLFSRKLPSIAGPLDHYS